MGTRERLAQLNAAKEAKAAPAAAPPPALKIPKKPKPPVVGTENLTHPCGHPGVFELYEEGKDKFRAERRKKITEQPCPECRKKAHQERTAQEQAAARERAAKRPPKLHGYCPSERLPHGARFDVTFDAQKVEWSGSLFVPGAATFEGTAPAVFKLLCKLDMAYREWCKPPATAASEAVTE